MISLLATLALLLPGRAAGVRQLHDTSRSCRWILIVFFVQDSHPDNSYGPHPKRAPAAA